MRIDHRCICIGGVVSEREKEKKKQKRFIRATTCFRYSNITLFDKKRTMWIGYYLLIGYVFSGVCIPLLIELISLNGGCETTTFLIALPNSIGACFLILLNKSARYKGTVRWKPIIVIAILEATSQAVVLDGLILAGSAIYTVAYSSVTMYTAVLAYLFLQKKLHPFQWIGVALVMCGLSLVSIGANQDGPDAVLGVVLILAGSLTHSINYVSSEYLLTQCEDPIEPELLAFFLGTMGSCFNMMWQIFYTIPHYETLIVQPIQAANGNVAVILFGYFFLTLANAMHALCFYNLLRYIGSTSTGLTKGLQSVLVFVFSHLIYCHWIASQCFTWSKGLSLVVVLSGIYLYSKFRLPTPTTMSHEETIELSKGLFYTRCDNVEESIDCLQEENDEEDLGVKVSNPLPSTTLYKYSTLESRPSDL